MVGVDIVVIDRVKKLYQRHGDKFLDRFLSKEELPLAKSVASTAGLWASKEAISKALKTGIGKELGFHDIVIYKDSKKAPHFKFSKKIVEKYCITDTSLSISHDGGFAIAVAVIETKK
jgi:holo-[acyl-carrier protein] synthase